MSLTKAEKETTIRWDEAERVVHVWTASEPVKRKCRKQGFREVHAEGEGVWFETPLAEFRWGRKRGSRVLSDKQRAVLENARSKSKKTESSWVGR